MDDVDRELIRLLQRDSRTSNKSLADAVGLAPSTTHARVARLEAEGVITGYHAHVDPRAVGRPLRALIFVRLHPKTEDSIRDFMDQAFELPACISVSLLTGTEDAVVEVAVADTDTLRTTILSKLAQIPSVVDERTALLFETRRKVIVPVDE